MSINCTNELSGEELPMSKTRKLPKRSEVPVEQTWNLDVIFPSDEAWETGYKEVDSLLPELSSYQGRLAESPQLLLEFLEVSERVLRLLERVYEYANLNASVDTADQDAAARYGQVGSLAGGLRFRRA